MPKKNTSSSGSAAYHITASCGCELTTNTAAANADNFHPIRRHTPSKYTRNALRK